MKKILAIQLQRELLDDNAFDVAIQGIENIANNLESPSTIKYTYDNDGAFVNIQFKSSDIEFLWHLINEQIINMTPMGDAIKKGAIIVCQRSSDWSDYLLLHHYDSSVRLNKLP